MPATRPATGGAESSFRATARSPASTGARGAARVIAVLVSRASCAMTGLLVRGHGDGSGSRRTSRANDAASRRRHPVPDVASMRQKNLMVCCLGLLSACSHEVRDHGPAPDASHQATVREAMDRALDKKNRLEQPSAYRFAAPAQDRVARWHFDQVPEG